MNCFNKVTPRLRASFCLALAALMCFTAASHAAKKPGRDRLAEALKLLNEAKEAANPIPLLNEAKDEVEGTLVPHKDAEREKAVKLIGDAINASLADKKKKEAIGRAIASVRALAGEKKKK